VTSQDGRSLNITETVRLISAQAVTDRRQALLPVTITKAQVATENAESLGIEELISEATTYFKGSSQGRMHNIQVAASRFHGLVIPPGGTFSFNEHLGEVSAATGYEESIIIWGNRSAVGIGGGVCQVSTTAFRIAFWGGYPIAERWAHGYRVGWYEPPVGMDATVYSSQSDFKFVNDTSHYLLIETETDLKAGTVTFRFYSTKTGRTVEIEGPFEANVVPHGPDVYREDATLPKGTTKQIDWAHDGVDVTVYRIVKEGDKVLWKDTFFSRYRPWQAVYLVGTGKGS
jgi:vancomycin resistance protein YoaR